MKKALVASRMGCCVALLVVVVGCQSTPKRDVAKMQKGYIYYCDGAGGGGLTNWAGGLKQGLREAGYPGSGEIFHWNTGLGVIADQDSSVKYKRGKARKMAQEAADYQKQYPGAPVHFMGLSAGTAVVVFGLEEMPGARKVDDVVLCGASISATYDLTRALKNLKGKLYIFTSSSDPVLGVLVPMAGTADRAPGTVPSAGLRGFTMPRTATSETRQLYRKVVTVPWQPEFGKLGYHGGHTDVLSHRFVAAHIAPRINGTVGSTPVELASTKGKVRNPDFERWKQFGVGSYTVQEGYQQYRGERSAVRVKATLVDRSATRVHIEREFFMTDDHDVVPSQVHSLIAEAWIDPKQNPVTDPRARVANLPGKTFQVKGKSLQAEGKSVAAGGSYMDWGADLKGTAYSNDAVPGHLVSLKLDSHFTGEPFSYEGRTVDFKVMR